MFKGRLFPQWFALSPPGGGGTPVGRHLSLLSGAVSVSLQVVPSHGDVHLPPRHWNGAECRYVCVCPRMRAHTPVKDLAVSLALGTISLATRQLDLEEMSPFRPMVHSFL